MERLGNPLHKKQDGVVLLLYYLKGRRRVSLIYT